MKIQNYEYKIIRGNELIYSQMSIAAYPSLGTVE